MHALHARFSPGGGCVRTRSRTRFASRPDPVPVPVDVDGDISVVVGKHAAPSIRVELRLPCRIQRHTPRGHASSPPGHCAAAKAPRALSLISPPLHFARDACV